MALRERMRRWLGIEALERQIPFVIPASRFTEYEAHERYLQEALDEIRFKLSKIEPQLASLKLPPNQRLAQLRSGLEILTSFANELQRDIERSVSGV